MSSTLVFNANDGVTGPITLDGFALADLGVITNEFEAGYVNGGRVEVGSSGLAPVVISAVVDAGTLVLGITCRGDTSFDDLDTVVIAVRESAGGEQRRIDLAPLWGDDVDPLPSPDPGIGYGAAKPSLADASVHLVESATDFGPPSGTSYDVRTNKPIHIGPTFMRRAVASGNWTPYTPATYQPTVAGNENRWNFKARSWKPSVTLGSPTECAWSIEARIPFDDQPLIAGDDSDWINLPDDFGIFIDVIRAFRKNPSTGTIGWGVVQYTFPFNKDLFDPNLDTTTDIPAASFGRGLKGAATALGEGVRIRNGSMGIGCRLAGSSALQGTISGTVDNTIVAQLDNTGAAASGIVAEVRMANWGLGPPQFNSWGLAPGCAVTSPPVALALGTPASPSAVVETGNIWLHGNVPAGYLPPLGHSHQCMWVQLRATGSPVVFTQASARRNMDFVGLSDVARDAEISAVGYPPPADGSNKQEFLLFTRCRKVVVSELIGSKQPGDETLAIVGGALQFAQQNGIIERVDIGMEAGARLTNVSGRTATAIFKNSVVFVWITEGLRRTHKSIKIRGIDCEIWDASPGDFSLAAYHNGVEDAFNWTLSGDGLVRHSDGVYGIKVKDGQTATIGVKLSASRDTKPGDLSDLPRNFPGEDGSHGGGDGGKNGGCGKQLLALALLPTGAYLLGQLFA